MPSVNSAGRIFRNRTAIFGWSIAILFLAGCMLFTWLVIRDGPGSVPIYPPDIPGKWPGWLVLLVLLGFWVAGAGALAYVAEIPCVQASILPDGSVHVLHRYLFHAERFMVRDDAVAPAVLSEEFDGDGDPYYRVRWASGRSDVVLAEGHDRERCYEVCELFNDGIKGRR